MRITVLVLALLILVSGPCQAEVSIIYGASLPEIADSRKGGLPALATFLNHARSRTETFFIFGGASLGPSMLSGMDQGSHIIDILNYMEPDVMQISKRELLFQEDQLSLRAGEAFFPFLASNMIDTRFGVPLEHIESSLLITKGEFCFGVISLVGQELLEAYPPRFVELLDENETVEKLADELRSKGADYIILLLDFSWPQVVDCLNRGIVDIAINNNSFRTGRVPTQHGRYIELNSEGTTAVEVVVPSMAVALYQLQGIPTDVHTRNKVEAYLEQLAPIINQDIGTTTMGFETFQAGVRSGEHPFANFVADTLRSTMNTDVALINGGLFRGNRSYSSHEVLNHGHMRIELPFQEEVMVLEVSGHTLWSALENGFSKLEVKGGRFPHISGMKVVYAPTGPMGDRVASVEINGIPLERERLYTLATIAYIADGGDGYHMFKTAQRLPLQPVLLNDVFRQRVQDLGSIVPVLDNRLQRLP